MLRRIHLAITVAGILATTTLVVRGETDTCLTVYREGGAPAVFQSPKCPRWTLFTGDEKDFKAPPETVGCHVASLQGRRPYQEDRMVCALHLRIPFLEWTRKTRIMEVEVGIIAIFDGHNGSEASDLASKVLLEYFLLHVHFLLDHIYSLLFRKPGEMFVHGGDVNHPLSLHLEMLFSDAYNKRFRWMLESITGRSFHMEILKEALLRTIDDIDLTFSQEAFLRNLNSGTTATVVLVADGQILTANVGDSKAFLCSEDSALEDLKRKGGSILHRHKRKKSSTSSDLVDWAFGLTSYNGTMYSVKQLTMDHHPERQDERERIEAAGGSVIEWAGVFRVNGQFSLSRAIGNVPYKRYGVISTPEVTNWHTLSRNDSFIVAASDGLFEMLDMQEVCNLLLLDKIGASQNRQSVGDLPNNLALRIVSSAFQKGSMDNIAAVVVPLGFIIMSGTMSKHPYIKGDTFVSSSLIEMDYFKHMTAKFQHFLGEEKHQKHGCFYLSENLNNKVHYIFRAGETYHSTDSQDFSNSSYGLTSSGHWLVGIYRDNSFCGPFGFQDGERWQYTPPEFFSNFVGLLGFLPSNSNKTTYSHPFGRKISDSRYQLNKRFDRGAYGEVWLAFRWNCTEDGDVPRNIRNHCSHLHGGSNGIDRNSSCESFPDNRDGDLFVLKRVMVERGNAAYLSGLREKYFGELFLNASNSLGALRTEDVRRTMFMGMHLDFSDMRSELVVDDESLKHIARYIESLEFESKEIWLVFKNEGLSLSKLIYTAEEPKLITGNCKDHKGSYAQVLYPSKWWYWLRTTKEGQKQMQILIWQLLMAVKACHNRNIIHRDIKPENMIVCFEDVKTGRCLREIPSGEPQNNMSMRIIDFGSAIDDFTMKHLYGSGPSRYEQTFEYSPPEALLSAQWFQQPKNTLLKYDMWSVGVVMLELIIGSPHVFVISDRTRALLDHQFEGWGDLTKELIYKLMAYMDLCILIPGIAPQQQTSASDNSGSFPASWKCSEESFSEQLKSRDPLKIGFPNVWALRLVRNLLLWRPEDRLSVDDALSHPYFQQMP